MRGDGIVMSFRSLFEFEARLAEYTGAPYVVVTDCCTHAIELAMRYDGVRRTRFSARTYISIPQMLNGLDIGFGMTDEVWQGEYQFHATRIWDSARRLEPAMYRVGAMQCVSFGHTKPLNLGRGGAVLLDDVRAYSWLSKARADGRDLAVDPWWSQLEFSAGWHYCPTLELCELGIKRLESFAGAVTHQDYPDLRNLSIKCLTTI
jgi:dTDP-4-amino-4,6-dideoxygalactose transaminase